MVFRFKKPCNCGLEKRGRRVRRGFSGASNSSAPGSKCTCYSESVFSRAHLRFQSCHSQQIVGACYKVGPGLRSVLPTVAAAPQSADRFDPAKDLFHPLADSLAGLVSRLGRGPAIQPRNLHAVLAGNMRRNFPLTAGLYKISPMVGFIGTERFGTGCPDAIECAGPTDAQPSPARAG